MQLFWIQWRGFLTLFKREVKRFFRIWIQTILPSLITTVLYYVIFGHLIGRRIGSVQGVPYMQFIVPGLVMMAVINNSYSNVSASFYGARFGRHIEGLLISPLSEHWILLGYVLPSAFRGLLVGSLVTAVSLFFTHLEVKHWGLMLFVAMITAMLFSLAGMINGLFARSFDDASFVPTFVLTPLTYLGGVFFSIHWLGSFWQTLAYANPILYLVNSYRYALFGVSDIGIWWAVTAAILTTIILYLIAWRCLCKGIGIRT